MRRMLAGGLVAMAAAGCDFDPPQIVAPQGGGADGAGTGKETDSAPTDPAGDGPLAPPDAPETPAVVAALDGLRWESPCLAKPDWEEFSCSAGGRDTDTVFAGGSSPGRRHQVTLRIRGVVEESSYREGTKVGPWYVDGESSTPDWNVYRLSIGGTSYFLNAGSAGQLRCWPLDYLATVLVSDGDAIETEVDPRDGIQVRNTSDTWVETPILVEGVAPYPDAYDGQFLQVDVVGWLAL